MLIKQRKSLSQKEKTHLLKGMSPIFSNIATWVNSSS